MLRKTEYSSVDNREITILGKTRKLSPHGGALLSPRGNSLAFDIGLLMARLLLRDHPSYRWATPEETRIITKLCGKPYTSVSYNSPTIVEQDGSTWFDPSLIMGVAVSVACQRWPPEKWADVYSFNQDTATTESKMTAVLDRSRSAYERGMFARMLGETGTSEQGRSCLTCYASQTMNYSKAHSAGLSNSAM